MTAKPLPRTLLSRRASRHRFEDMPVGEQPTHHGDESDDSVGPLLITIARANRARSGLCGSRIPFGRFFQLYSQPPPDPSGASDGTHNRRQRIEALISELKSEEERQVQATAIKQEEQMERVRQVVEGMRGLR